MTTDTLIPATDSAIGVTAIGEGSVERLVSEQQVREIATVALAPLDLTGKRVLLIVPDSTRTAPVDGDTSPPSLASVSLRTLLKERRLVPHKPPLEPITAFDTRPNVLGVK